MSSKLATIKSLEEIPDENEENYGRTV